MPGSIHVVGLPQGRLYRHMAGAEYVDAPPPLRAQELVTAPAPSDPRLRRYVGCRLPARARSRPVSSCGYAEAVACQNSCEVPQNATNIGLAAVARTQQMPCIRARFSRRAAWIAPRRSGVRVPLAPSTRGPRARTVREPHYRPVDPPAPRRAVRADVQAPGHVDTRSDGEPAPASRTMRRFSVRWHGRGAAP